MSDLSIWDKVPRFVCLLAFAFSILALSNQLLPAIIINSITNVIIIYDVITAPAFQLNIHWRSFLLYSTSFTSNIIFALSGSVGVITISIIIIVIDIVTILFLILFPTPSARKLLGPHKRIGTYSFNIPYSYTSSENIFPSANCIAVQSWFPIDPEHDNSFLNTIWQILFSPSHAVLWTSGHPKEQLREQELLLTQLSINYKIPDYLLHHLTLAKSQSEFQESYGNIISSSTLGNILQQVNNGYSYRKLDQNKKEEIGPLKFPIAIYSHGMYSWRQFHTSLFEELASHGFIVFALDHAPDSMISRPIGRLDECIPFSLIIPEGTSVKAEYYHYNNNLENRANQLKKLIDYISSPEGLMKDCPSLQNRLELSKFHLWGHSYGGATVCTASCRDERISRVAVLDGWLYPVPENDRKQGMKANAALYLTAELWIRGK
eukprot:gene11859-15869_t